MEIRPYDYGGLEGVYDIDPGVSVTGIYSTLIDHLKAAGYIERKDLFGSPYDFRLAADGLTQVCRQQWLRRYPAFLLFS